MQLKRFRLLAIFVLLALFACGEDDGGGFDLSKKGQIEIEPLEYNVEITIGQSQIGEAIAHSIRVKNVADGVLTVSKLQLDYQAPEGGDSHSPAFQLLEDQELPIELAPVNSADGATEFTLKVEYTRQEDFAGRTATLTIVSDSREESILTVNFKEKQASAIMVLTPIMIDFGTVPLGQTGERMVSIQNTGTDDLIVDSFVLRNHPDFSLVVDDEAYPVSEETATKALLVEPIIVKAGALGQVKITFSPQTPAPASGELILYSNDANAPNGRTVGLLANHDVPCILVKPSELEFGGKFVGVKSQLPVQICNCAEAPLKISGMALVPDETSADFSLVIDVPGIDPITGIDPNVPYVVEVNECIKVQVQCLPDKVNDLDAENQPIPDLGLLRIQSNSFEQVVDVPVSCIGVNLKCPVAVAGVQEGEQVIPQTTLHLIGDQSFSPVGLPIKNYEWKAEQPEGSTSKFVPNATFPNPVFEVNVAGEYTFILSVRDEQNETSCEDAVIKVVVIPDEAIHVELTWSTEKDDNLEDEGEGNGADMDLHFAHPFGLGPDLDADCLPDPWYDTTFDCFYFNKTPNWGTFDPDVDDDPSLDRDDIDGWGPENLNINIPEEGADYLVGVHYWNDHEFGQSIATVRVYIYGELDMEVANVTLNPLDLWKVARIPWKGGTSQTEVLTKSPGTCVCNAGYQAVPCGACQDVDECLIGNGGCGDAKFDSCTNTMGGFTCDDIDECATDNGGCGNNATCTNQDGKAADCACNPGYAYDDLGLCVITAACQAVSCEANSHCDGAVCVCDAGHQADAGGICQDVDECDTGTDDCGDAAFSTCTNTVGSFTCADIDECATDNGGCGANTTCINKAGAEQVCVCSPGYQLDAGECVKTPQCQTVSCLDGNSHCESCDLECAENEVCQVGTEEGAAAACVGKYLITPKYQNPMFISPCICKG